MPSNIIYACTNSILNNKKAERTICNGECGGWYIGRKEKEKKKGELKKKTSDERLNEAGKLKKKVSLKNKGEKEGKRKMKKKVIRRK